jgi:hypothetical protein
MYSYDGQDLLTRLEEHLVHMAGVEDKRATEAMGLSQLVMGFSDVLFDLGLCLIWDIPQCPKLAQEVFVVTGLILERLREEHASGAGPWV